MSESLVDARPVPGTAIAALTVGVLSIAAIPLMVVATLPLGVVALVLGLVSRRTLRRDPTLRGSRISLAGFLLGISGMILGGAVPLALMLLWRLFGSGD
ncbi:hypothetical protein [Frigoribacterium sp. UYMn621]|jgi:hypothetical protein|uniref:hypothetical protein n=1 Tax=Frigoribacterium sp. UYMn621 TaxID=3156343 RepID=UPI00339A35B5